MQTADRRRLPEWRPASVTAASSFAGIDNDGSALPSAGCCCHVQISQATRTGAGCTQRGAGSSVVCCSAPSVARPPEGIAAPWSRQRAGYHVAYRPQPLPLEELCTRPIVCRFWRRRHMRRHRRWRAAMCRLSHAQLGERTRDELGTDREGSRQMPVVQRFVADEVDEARISVGRA